MAQSEETTPSRTITLDECKAHNTDKSCWLVVHGKVYDVTEFLEEHPGGYDIILSATGKDATEDFDEIGHSGNARKLLDKYYLGNYAGGDSSPPSKPTPSIPLSVEQKSGALRTFHILLPVLLLLIAIVLNVYVSKGKPSASAGEV